MNVFLCVNDNNVKHNFYFANVRHNDGDNDDDDFLRNKTTLLHNFLCAHSDIPKQ